MKLTSILAIYILFWTLSLFLVLPFGGFSCIGQTYSMICHTDLSIRPYLGHKLVQTALTALCYAFWKPF